ncbi:hypothetical protein [Nocardia sp. NPDC051832]|uniref:hypothetical protein n=1 Tax=Nocardia sp. NPDC051832 TaxID=3155673 RepID=UPI00341DB4AA
MSGDVDMRWTSPAAVSFYDLDGPELGNIDDYFQELIGGADGVASAAAAVAKPVAARQVALADMRNGIENAILVATGIAAAVVVGIVLVSIFQPACTASENQGHREERRLSPQQWRRRTLAGRIAGAIASGADARAE